MRRGWTTGSTKKELRVEICSKCHPFFTGKQKLVDTAGRIDRFQRKYGEEARLQNDLALARLGEVDRRRVRRVHERSDFVDARWRR